ncbi:hypothetical protein M1247_30250 [Mycobacterium sp. 21AC1]|uniref:hypothetical protein n=1 Tax=[Mycobacterium] appelbergii TaxID=2939269 RepID=UPI0029390E6E|nr:hypothetical protein [Mycobacterium sp. 21AC1]MDV3129220.1 hypothetical protein [Mycobacterium sp. 21AC1]
MVHRSWVRNTAISCAVACGAMVAGPGMVGTSVASADLLGIDIDVFDLFDHKPKKNKKSHSGGAKVGAQHNGGTQKTGGPRRTGLGGPAQRGPEKKAAVVDRRDASESSGQARRSAPSADAPESTQFGGTRQALPGVASGGGGGGGEVPTNSNIGRAPNLAPVPTTPSARSIVIRANPPEAPVVPVSPPAAPVPVAPVPVAAPPLPVVVPPLPSPPSGGMPSSPSGPSLSPPSSEPPPADSLTVRSIPDSFRIGYADYLRAASTTDLLFAVLPGVAGMVLLTAAGGVAGYRQARAAQTLPSPQIARFLP